MVKYREIIRLRALGVSLRNIAFSCGCSKNTVQSVLQRATIKGVEWPLPDAMSDAALRAVLFEERREPEDRAAIDFTQMDKELKRKGVTLMLLWNEYCESALAEGKQPFQYSSFCDQYRKWARTNHVVMHIERKPAEEMQLDWCGATACVINPDTGDTLKVYVFVATLPYSSYSYMEGFYRMDIQAWISAHLHAFSYFGGTTPILRPDNLKTGVIKNTFDELIINESYRQMCEYYSCAAIPARVRKPRDKGAVEKGVSVATSQAIAALRNETFFDLRKFNEALWNKMESINERAFQKKEGSRKSVFLAEEKERLIPLPPRPFEIAIRSRVTVQFNYHVVFEGMYYSVPFNYVKREVELSATNTTVSIFCDGARIAMHVRVFSPKGSYVTNKEHMPDNHRDYLEWTGERFRRWATTIGEPVAEVVDAILKSRAIEQQSYRSCQGVLRLEKKYGSALLVEACEKALIYSPRPSYKTVKSIISGLFESTNKEEHGYLRGANYYENDNN